MSLSPPSPSLLDDTCCHACAPTGGRFFVDICGVCMSSAFDARLGGVTLNCAYTKTFGEETCVKWAL